MMTWKLSVGIVAILVLCCTLVCAEELDIIKQAIEEQGVEWEAQANPISDLPDEVLVHMMGVILPPIDPEEHEIGEMSLSVPPEWDWRDVNGSTWVTPVKNQGNCGSCWAFGAVAELESATMLSKFGIVQVLDLSEQYMVSCDKSNFGCNGGYMDRAYDFLMDEGVPIEACFPYKAKDLPCSDACSDPILANIEDWHSVSQKIADLQGAVYLQPITAAFYVYRDFTYYKSGIYKHVSGELLGGHAICVVGWSTKDECFIVKNSWGSDWGEEGYFRIAFSEMSSVVKFGIQAAKFDIPPELVAVRTLVGMWGELKR
jgi:C1A family cysteine protease